MHGYLVIVDPPGSSPVSPPYRHPALPTLLSCCLCSGGPGWHEEGSAQPATDQTAAPHSAIGAASHCHTERR